MQRTERHPTVKPSEGDRETGERQDPRRNQELDAKRHVSHATV